MVPYLEAGAELMTGQATRVVPAVEVGIRSHFSRIDITPFFRWGRYQEYLTENRSLDTTLVAKHALFAGARVETLMDADYLAATPRGTGIEFIPEIHGTASYGFHLPKRNSKGYGNIELDFEVLRLRPCTMFFYTGLFFNTRKEDLKPDKLVGNLQYGLTYEKGDFFLEGFLKHGRRLDANRFRGTQERFNLAGLRIGTKAMKPGQVNLGIDFSNPEHFQWLNRWNGQVSVGHFFQNHDWQYLWEVSPKLRWDILRWFFIIPYVQGELTWLYGGGPTGDAVEPAVEAGFRFHGTLDLLIYYRYQRQDNSLFFRGLAEDQSILGVRVLF
jgi:hypothetical protein